MLYMIVSATAVSPGDGNRYAILDAITFVGCAALREE
jgi:hypothetical protein